jgi:hypothetical protein
MTNPNPSPELVKTRALAHAWSGDGNRCIVTGYDGPICLRCGLPDLPTTGLECIRNG